MTIERGNNKSVRINLYLLNFALLFTHKIDSAFWKEWELFGIPGGIRECLLSDAGGFRSFRFFHQ